LEDAPQLQALGGALVACGEPAATPTAAPTPAPTATPLPPPPAKVDEWVEFGNASSRWSLRVRSAEELSKVAIWSTAGNRSAASGVWLIVIVELANQGTATQALPPQGFTVV